MNRKSVIPIRHARWGRGFRSVVPIWQAGDSVCPARRDDRYAGSRSGVWLVPTPAMSASSIASSPLRWRGSWVVRFITATRLSCATYFTSSPHRFRLPTPKESEPFAMPTDEYTRLDIHQRIRPLETSDSELPPISEWHRRLVCVWPFALGRETTACGETDSLRQGTCGNGPRGKPVDYPGHSPKAVCHGAENR